MNADSTVRVLLLGPPRLERSGETLAVDRRKSLGLLAYLSVSRQPVARETLAALFWPDSDTTRGLANLRTLIWSLNSIGADWALTDGETLALNLDANIYIDVHHFRKLLTACPDATAPDEATRRRCVDLLREAVALYRDDFMAGFSLSDSNDFEDWQYFTREGLRHALAGALERLVTHLAALNETSEAIDHARRWLALDPLHEPAHRALMRLYAWTDQTAAAHRQYQEARRILDDELGVPVDAETEALYRSIQERSLPQPWDTQAMRRVSSESGTTSTPPAAPPPTAVVQLPGQTTPFMGRHSELEQIATLLDERPYRLITLHGPGGVGKTRLAVEAARRAHFDDGVYFVPLAPVMTVDFLPAAIAKSLPFYEDGPGDVRGRLIDALRERDVLLVLDNCEHLLAGADLVTLLLSNAPRVTILATSREPLNLQGEWVIDLFGLDFPERGPASGDTAGWDAHGAINLFMDRARRVRGDFTLEWHNRDAVREICALVDGLPLGLELAATWIRIMTPDQIVNEIRNSMDFLSTTLRDLPERHRSLRAVFEQSWQHLGENEQQHFSRMSMFTGPFSLEAAQSVAKTGPHILLTLVDKSLLRRNEDGLFEIHELIRQYAADKLTGDDRAEAEARYRSFYAGFLQRQLPVLRSGEELFALWHIGLAMNNIRNAWRMAVASGDRSFFRLSVDTLWHYYDVYRHAEEQSNLGQQAVEGLTAGVDSDDDLPDEDRLLLGRLLAMQLSGVRQMAHQSEVRQLALRCHHLIDAFPDRVETALPLILLAGSFNIPGQRNAEALAMTDNALHLFERAGDRWGQAFALANSGWTLQNSLRYQEVGAVAQRALSIFTALDHPSGLLVTYALLFENAVTFGDTDAARQYGTAEVAVLSRLGHDGWSDSMRFALHELNEEDPDPDKMRQSIEESIASYRMTGDRNHLAWTVYRLGWIHLYKDRFAEADTAYTEALGIFYELGDAEGIGWTLIFRAIVALELKRIVEARRLAEQALVEVEGTDLVWCVCGALYVLGDVELAEGNLDAARDNYLESIRIAHGVQSLLQTLRHLCGLADWMLHMGMTQQAVSLLTYIRMQPTSGLDTRRRARRLLEVAAEQMSHSGFRAAQSRGEKLTLDDALTVAEQV